MEFRHKYPFSFIDFSLDKRLESPGGIPLVIELLIWGMEIVEVEGF